MKRTIVSLGMLMVTDADLPCAVTVRVSAPSVSRSAAIGTLIVAVPLELTVALPLSSPPAISAALTLDSV